MFAEFADEVTADGILTITVLMTIDNACEDFEEFLTLVALHGEVEKRAGDERLLNLQAYACRRGVSHCARIDGFFGRAEIAVEDAGLSGVTDEAAVVHFGLFNLVAFDAESEQIVVVEFSAELTAESPQAVAFVPDVHDTGEDGGDGAEFVTGQIDANHAAFVKAMAYFDFHAIVGDFNDLGGEALGFGTGGFNNGVGLGGPSIGLAAFGMWAAAGRATNDWLRHTILAPRPGEVGGQRNKPADCAAFRLSGVAHNPATGLC